MSIQKEVMSPAQTKRLTMSTALDLSGAAVVGRPILHTEAHSLKIHKVALLYTEASSADAGVTVTVGNESSASAFYTGTSLVSRSLWHTTDVNLLSTALAAGNTLVCGSAGGKTGAGEIMVCVEYSINDD